MPYPIEGSAPWNDILEAEIDAEDAALQAEIDALSGTGGDMLKSENLAGLTSLPDAQANLGLRGAATLDVGQETGTVAAGDDPRIVGALQASDDLLGVNPANARVNLDVFSTEEVVTLLGEALPNIGDPVTLLHGGTGASDAAGARLALDVYSVGQVDTLIAGIGGGVGTITSVDGQTGPTVDLSGSYQPLNSNLTSYAAVAPTSLGLSLLAPASQAAARTLLGLGTIAVLAAPSGTVVGTSDTQTLTNKTLTAPAITSPTGIVASDIASGTFAIGRIPTGTDSTHVPVGGVIAAAGPQGDGSHTQVLTWNAAGQVTTVTNTSIAISAAQVTSGLSGTYAPLASPTFTGTVSGITSTMVGLGNVDNTSDATKNSAAVTLSNKTIAAGVGAAFTAGTLVGGGTSMTGGGIDPLNRLHLQNSYTLTATPTDWTIGTPLWLETNVVLNNPTSGLDAFVGPQPSGGGFLGPAGQISFSGTTQYNVSAPSVFSFPPIVMLDAQIIKNQPGHDRTISPAWSVLMCKTLVADNGTMTLRRPDSTPGWFPFNDSQILVTGTTTTGTGTIDGVTNSVWMGSFMSTPFTFGNTHLYRRVGFYAADLNEYRPDGSTDSSDGYRTQFVDNGTLVSADAGPGTIDQNIGVLIDHMDGGVQNVGIWNGSSTVEPAQSQTLAAGSVITASSTNLDVTTAGGTADVTLTTNPWIAAGLDGQRIRINSNATTGKITLTNGHGALFPDGNDLILMPGTGVNLEYKSVFGTWVEPTFRTARTVYNPNMSGGGAYRLRSTGTNAGALEFRTADSDANPVASYGMAGATAGAWGFGPGGASTLDYSFARTNTATATVTGTTIMATTKLQLGGVTSAALGEANLGLATLTSHGLILGAGAGAFTALALDASTTKYLKSGGSSAGPSWATINVTDIPTAAALASPTFTGTVVLPLDQIFLTTAGAGTGGLKVWDGTAADGAVFLNAHNIGVGVQGVSVMANSTDANAVINMVGANGVAAINMGVGGATATSWQIAFTSAALATMTGSLIGTFPRSGTQTQTGTTYTLVAGDAGKTVTMNNAAGMTLTIPANSSVAFPIGTNIPFYNKGAGTMTLAITTDTLLGTTSYVANKGGILHKLTATIWMVLPSA